MPFARSCRSPDGPTIRLSEGTGEHHRSTASGRSGLACFSAHRPPARPLVKPRVARATQVAQSIGMSRRRFLVPVEQMRGREDFVASLRCGWRMLLGD
jgi:hypothetical protein